MIFSNRLFSFLGIAICILATTPSLQAIVLHTDDQVPQDSRPSDNVMGRWSTNASCVVINPNYIITTRHQGGDYGTTITIAGIPYKATQIYNVYDSPDSIDMRIVRITQFDSSPANLHDYIDIYEETDSTLAIVMGGFGKSRGENIISRNKIIGYYWLGTNSQTLRWGANDTLGTEDSPISNYGSQTLRCLFDKNGDYQAAIAEWDSGGGWFYNDNGQWKLVALSAYITTDGIHADSSLFDYPFYGIQVSTYQTYINDAIPENPVIISGHVLNYQNAPVGGITIDAPGTVGYTKTDSTGYYELWVPSGWNGTITPAPSDSTFKPANYSYYSVITDTNNQNFQIDTITISGYVYDNNFPAENVLIDANSQASTTTDANGYFQIPLDIGFTGTITPSFSDNDFVPIRYSYDYEVITDINEQNFKTYITTDLDQDGFLDFNDIEIFSIEWLSTDPNSPADITGDNIADFQDWALFQQAWQ